MTLGLKRERRILEVSEEMGADLIYSDAESVINQGIDMRLNSLDQQESSASPSQDVKFQQIRAILSFIQHTGNFQAYTDMMFLSSALKNLGEELRQIKGLDKYFNRSLEELKELGSNEVDEDYQRFKRIVKIEDC